MLGWSVLERARERTFELRVEAARARLARYRHARVPVRRRVAQAMRTVGRFFLEIGSYIETAQAV